MALQIQRHLRAPTKQKLRLGRGSPFARDWRLNTASSRPREALGEEPARTPTDQSLRDNSPSSEGAEWKKKNPPHCQAHPSASEETQKPSPSNPSISHLEKAAQRRVGRQRRPPSPRSRLLALQLCLPACRIPPSPPEPRFCFFGLRREPAAPSHTRQRRPARLESQHAVAWLRNGFPRSSHAFGPSCKRERVAPHYHQVTGTEILDVQQPVLAPNVSRRLEKTGGQACQRQRALLLLETTFKLMPHACGDRVQKLTLTPSPPQRGRSQPLKTPSSPAFSSFPSHLAKSHPELQRFHVRRSRVLILHPPRFL